VSWTYQVAAQSYSALCLDGRKILTDHHFLCDFREKKDLEELSSLGHFLKGSSATLGLVKVRDACEAIQRYGKNENLDGSTLDDDEKCLELIRDSFTVVKKDYDVVKEQLERYYENKE
jgi:osomolarity two-component system phosphorelay intermediate protein YPD1